MALGGLVFSLRRLPEPVKKHTFKEALKKFDYIGLAIFIPATASLLLVLQWGGVRYPWKSPITIGLLCVSGVLILLWAYSQHRLGERATIPIRLITQRTVLSASIYVFCTSATYNVLLYYLPLYFQGVGALSATASGIQTAPLIIAVTAFSVISGILVSVLGYFNPFMIAGPALLTISLALFTTVGVTIVFRQLVVYEFIAGMGIGMTLQVLYETHNN